MKTLKDLIIQETQTKHLTESQQEELAKILIEVALQRVGSEIMDKFSESEMAEINQKVKFNLSGMGNLFDENQEKFQNFDQIFFEKLKEVILEYKNKIYARTNPKRSY